MEENILSPQMFSKIAAQDDSQELDHDEKSDQNSDADAENSEKAQDDITHA